MSCKSALSNSIKSNSEQQQWPKAQTSVETNVKLAGDEAKDRLYEPKHKKKVVRVLTVVAYVFSVSLAAIMLSLYYIFIWNPQSRAAGARHASEGEAKPRYNCPEMMNEEALAQIKADVSSLGTTAPVDGSWQTTTAGDSAESVYDEASSSETKIDESNLLLSNLEGTMLNSYESGDDVINNTAYK